MPVQSISTLKSYFETGDVPTEAQFIDLMDTLFSMEAAANKENSTLSNSTSKYPTINLLARALQNALPNSATASGTNTYTAGFTPALTAYVATQAFFITFTNANTLGGASATLNIDSLGAKQLVRSDGNVLLPGDIVAGTRYLLMYNGTVFYIQGISRAKGFTMSGPLSLGEGSIIARPNSPLSADGVYSGDTEGITLGETLAYGDIVYFKAADSKWWKAKADATSTSGPVRVGMIVVGGAANASGTILLPGAKLRADAKFPSLSVGAPVYISGATAGEITSTAPTTSGHIVRIIGYAWSGDEITFDPSISYTVVGQTVAPCEFIVACSDESTAITTGTAKVTFRAPYAFTLTAVRASVNTAPTGSTIIIDINENGSTVLSTKLSIDASELTSTTAAAAAVISDSAIADDAEITIDFDQVGSTIAGKGVKVILIGTHLV